MTARTTVRSLFFGGLIFACTFSCLGQTSTSILSGTVFDSSGAVVTGAIVNVLNEATGSALRQLTNSAGLYAFPSIPVGSYTVTVEAAGLQDGAVRRETRSSWARRSP